TRCYRDWSSDVCSSDLDFKQRDNWWVVVIGRLKRGVSEVQARAAVDVIFRRSIGPLVKPNADPPTIPSIALYSSSRGLEMLRQRSEERRVGKEGRLRAT